MGSFPSIIIEALKKAASALILQNTWTTVPWIEADNVIKSTWAFKLNRIPDGTPNKFNARFCVRGDLQKEGTDYFETYSPVDAWSTIRILLALVLQEGCTTCQVDYDNAFAQAELSESVFEETLNLLDKIRKKSSFEISKKFIWT